MPRKPGVWYRTERRMWYTTIRRKQVPLGVTDPNDRPAAEAAFRRARGDAPPAIAGPAAGLPADPAARALELARELLAVLPAVPELENRDRRMTSLRLLVIDLDVLVMLAEHDRAA